MHELLLKHIAKVRADDAETGDNFLKVDGLRIHIPDFHLGTLLLDIYKPVFWHFEVCLCVPMDIDRQAGQTYEYEGVAIYEYAYCRAVL